ncbi:hypothetical protein [Longimicrobium sp.]|uniref:hypothetical protein n=1 Tax=Longimicrobium sp. TaxID=2029185 RepID=UPI002D06A4BA|nr:hypothetical protein [Longimicrobium sp.]HSU14553.1 hypothetical protein [Longimicrobium sp.]
MTRRRLSSLAVFAALLLASACPRPDAGRARAPAKDAPPARSATPAPVSREPTAADSAAARARILNPGVDTAWVEPRFARRNVERQRLSTLDGTMTITADSIGGEIPVESTYHLAVNGREILAEEQIIDLGVYQFLQSYHAQAGSFNESGAVAVLDASAYGNTCPAMFRVLMMRFGRPPLLTPRFGNCSESPQILRSGGRLRMRFPGFYTYWQSRQSGFRAPPDELYDYRGTEMVKLSPPPRAGDR